VRRLPPSEDGLALLDNGLGRVSGGNFRDQGQLCEPYSTKKSSEMVVHSLLAVVRVESAGVGCQDSHFLITL
jgi:hypothetical protein